MRQARDLAHLRTQSEAGRLARLREDDARTAIGRDAGAALARSLAQEIEGEVRFDDGTRALYATDGSNYRQAPIGVVIPRSAQDVETTVRLAREHGAPVLSRGGGTSLAGQCCNVAVILDFSKYMHHVLEIDADKRLARVEPGCVLDRLRTSAKQQAGLYFGPDPSTHSRCTLGGMLGNNSCGSHSLLSKKHGFGLRTSDNTHALDVLLYDGTRMHVGPTPPDMLDKLKREGGRVGEIYSALSRLSERYGNVIRERYPKLGRRVSGYNLDELLPENGFHVARALVGSESTLVTIVEATLHLVPAPVETTVVMLGFPDVVTAASCGLELLKFDPIACEGIDDLLFDYVRKKGDENASLAQLPKGQAFLLAEFEGKDKQESDGQARRAIEHVKTLGEHAPVDYRIYDDPKQEEMVWSVREGGLGSTAWVPGQPDTWPGWEDSAVPVEVVPQYLRELRGLFRKFGYNPSMYGHIGQGCVHCRVQFDLYTKDGIAKYRRFMDEAVTLVTKLGGVASGEHGDGQARGQFLARIFGDELAQAFVEFKRIWDPQNRMNTGKVVNLEGPPYGITDNLRIGADYNPPEARTHFAFTEDHGSFGRAALRCVGVGTCRREGGGTMCPSYMVTREEKHSTRGRARLLFEMMNGEIIQDGWKSDAVKDALDLCLSCKGCKGDCPVNVDMAAYKAEFLSHYYEGRVRPRHAYAFGWIHHWARLASVAPSLANLITQTSGLSTLAKLAAGMHPRRQIPAFAPRTFTAWFADREPRNADGPPVLLFPDTFNNFFHPDVAADATEALERMGFCVHVPKRDVCCGRPLYDYGFLAMAKQHWRKMLAVLRPYYQQSIPTVVLEPSCYSAFKDELAELLPSDLDGKRLRETTYMFSDFLRAKASHYALPKLGRAAVVHGHCHQKALDVRNDKELGKLFAEKELMDRLGIEHSEPEAGCCGMAGAFGYEKADDHYDVSVACGERLLLPKVRATSPETIIIADGFSCQEQIEQSTSRTALHTAQVVRMALDGPAGVPAVLPESGIVERRRLAQRLGKVRAGMLLGAGLLAIVLVRRYIRHRRSGRSLRGLR